MSRRAAVSIHGADELVDRLKVIAKMEEAKRIVKMNSAEMQQNMVRSASFTQGYQTGTTKRSISLAIVDEGLTGVVGPGTNYSPYLIYGTRFMAAQDFFRPNYYTQEIKFRQDIQRLVN